VTGVSDAAQFRDWRRNQTAVTAATFIGFTGFTLVMPFLPLYFELLGVHETSAIALWSGLSLGVTPAVTAVMAPIWARLAERFGRKVMVARSLGSFVVIMSLMAFVRAPWQVFVLRAIQGLFAGYGPIAMTMAAESAPPEHMATALGWVQTAQRLGPALGPVVGGALAQTLGLRYTFVVSAGVYLAAFALVVIGYREAATRKLPDAAVAEITFARLRRVPHFMLFMGTIFGLQLVDRSFGPILPLYLIEIGLPADQAPFMSGVIFTTTAGAAAFGNLACRWLLERRHVSSLVPFMAGVGAIGAVVFAIAPPWAVLIATALAFGFALGVATTSVYTAATHAVSAEARGVSFGYLTTAYLAGLAVSPVVAGLIGSLSMRAVFVADAVGLALVAVIVFRRMSHAAR
jgi:DHA1 family multidrug resistance protein-like MFS transporter